MCGIVGYVGNCQAAPLLLEGLSKLEYRGYDSAGIAVRDIKEDNIKVVKAKGRLAILSEMTDNGRNIHGTCGIGHTRWATHGEPSTENAHPHFSAAHRVTMVHNGIIENYQEIKQNLMHKGYEFHSQTDTEVCALLLDYYYPGITPEMDEDEVRKLTLDAITQLMLRVRGSYALGIMFTDQPGVIYAVRKDSPLIVGHVDHLNVNGMMIASDVPAILKYSRSVYYLENLEIARLTQDTVDFYTIEHRKVDKQPTRIEWDQEAAEKGGYEHFMIKEIHEQPKAVRDTILPRVVEHDPARKGSSGKDVAIETMVDPRLDLSELDISDAEWQSYKRIYIVACGSAYHVGIAAKYVIEKLVRVPVDVDIASEFRYRDPILEPDSLFIVISQSGETADSLAALRLAKEIGVPTLAIVNVLGSSIAREADHVLYTWAGPEIAVATTKAYSTQLAAMYMIAMEMARVRETIDAKRYTRLMRYLIALPDQIQMLLKNARPIQRFAARFANSRDIFFVGRGLDYAISMEGSLKLKEISYIHSEAYPAGELKHGTISLIEDGILVVGVLTQTDILEKTMSNMIETKSRGAYLFGIVPKGSEHAAELDFAIEIPRTDELFATSLAVVPLQLLGYYIGCARGLDVDKPRNLAKSVTVE